jgi:hypothetical protein
MGLDIAAAAAVENSFRSGLKTFFSAITLKPSIS